MRNNPPPRRTAPPPAATRAIRKRPTKRRRRSSRGKKFFLVMLFILAFALIYNFGGEQIFGVRTGDVVLELNEIMVSFIDVGQGDSILIRSANHAVLIDGGEAPRRNSTRRNALRDYLREAGVRRLDYVVATHPDSDHIGGLIDVLGRLDIGRVIMPDITHNTETFANFLAAIDNNNIPVTFPNPGDSIRIGIIEFTVIAPPNPHPGPANSNNNASIVLRLEHGQTSFLFTGDAERELEQWIVNSGANIESSVLKVGHHGSRTSSTEAFLDAVNPTAAVISLAANNSHGHPHREVIDRLTDRGINIYRTDQLGTIRMITNGQQIYFHR